MNEVCVRNILTHENADVTFNSKPTLRKVLSACMNNPPLDKPGVNRPVRGYRAHRASHLLESLESRVLLSGLVTHATDPKVTHADAGNHAPTLTKVAPFATAIADNAFPISYGQLLAASNGADVDGDTLQFQITSLGAGTASLTLNGDPVTSFPATVSARATLWCGRPTPPAKARSPHFPLRRSMAPPLRRSLWR